MIHAIRELVRQLRDRRRRCSLCGCWLRASVTTYGFYRFCSRDHFEEWRHFNTL